MTDVRTPPGPTSPGSGWRALLRPPHLGAMVVLAGGVALYATNVYLTTSLLPSAVREIGGQRFYAWTTTVFLLASVVSSVLVGRLLAGLSGRGAYLVALGAFVAGTLGCAAAPDMPVLLAGRAVQGFGGGLLAGLGYALIRSTLPAGLWARGSALVSAMWGVGTFLGPALGGAFAQFASWRDAFLALAAAGVLIAAVVPVGLRGGRAATGAGRFPLAGMLLLTAAALAVSVAGLAGTVLAGLAGVLAGLALVGVFLLLERRDPRVLPAATFTAGGRLGGCYATIALLAVGSTTETFVPLFGQRLAGLAPLAAGFLGAALAAGWTLGELPSAEAGRPGTARRIVLAGPVVLAAGLALAAVCGVLTGGGVLVACWVVALLVAGSGIGMAWPHLATWAMGSVRDPADGDTASAAINTVQLLANTVGAALTGVAVNLGEPDPVRSAGYLFGGFAVLAALGLVAATRAARRDAAPG
jgi:MFS family permease